jgi:hypothetical protein
MLRKRWESENEAIRFGDARMDVWAWRWLVPAVALSDIATVGTFESNRRPLGIEGRCQLARLRCTTIIAASASFGPTTAAMISLRHRREARKISEAPTRLMQARASSSQTDFAYGRWFWIE